MASVSGKRLILEPSGVHALTPAFFTAPQRRSPVYFPYSWSEFDTLHIRLPERWKAETLDHPGAISAPGVLRYDAKMTMNGDRELVYVRELQVGEGGPVLVAVQGYADAKKVFDHVNACDRATATFVRPGGGP